MQRRYSLRLLIFTVALAFLTFAAIQMQWIELPAYNWIGLGYLVILTWAVHLFVQRPAITPNAGVRRLMLASFMRMFGALIFLVITLFNARPANVNFIGFYCVYFCLFVLFEISQMRTNLRPDSEPRPKNENA